MSAAIHRLPTRPVRKALRKLAIEERGYGIVYHAGEQNRCPSCHGNHWHIGRTMAECANCAAALPLVDKGKGGANI